MDKALEFNLKSIEIRVSRDGIHIRPDEDLSYLKRVIRDRGLRVSLLASYVRTCDPTDLRCRESLEELEKILRISYEIECGRVRVLAGYIEDLHNSIITIRRFLDRVESLSREYNTLLLFETHDYFAERHNLERLIEVVREYRDVSGILYDPANMLIRNTRVEESLRIVREYTYHVHIKDLVILGGGRYRYTRPGEGVLPICRVLRELWSRDVVFSIEWERMWVRELENSDLIIPLYLDYMMSCL
ncbi:MAG: sugar phosphate isomerase/epimerase family protein [Sulfolobales archaeon]